MVRNIDVAECVQAFNNLIKRLEKNGLFTPGPGSKLPNEQVILAAGEFFNLVFWTKCLADQVKELQIRVKSLESRD